MTTKGLRLGAVDLCSFSLSPNCLLVCTIRDQGLELPYPNITLYFDQGHQRPIKGRVHSQHHRTSSEEDVCRRHCRCRRRRVGHG